MKEVVEYYGHMGIIFKSFRSVAVKDLGSRKRVDIYIGVNQQGYYVAVFSVSKKSRILRKEASEFVDLHAKLEKYIDSKILLKYIWIKAPLCSKAKKLLEEKKWKVDVSV